MTASMGALLVYLIKSSLLLAVLVSLFMLFMSRETFHKLNRYLLLMIVGVSLVLPFVNVGVDTPLQGFFEFVENGGEKTSEVFEMPYDDASDANLLFDDVLSQHQSVLSETLPAGELTAAHEEGSAAPLWQVIVLAIYGLGALSLLIRLAIVYVQVVRLVVKGKAVAQAGYGLDGISLRVHGGKEKPFSWFRWVVVSEDDLCDGAREILTHEAAHVKAGHSWDIMLADAVIIMQWFNPLAWIMKNTLKDIHEFEADEAVIASGVNAKQYQLLIIKKAVGARLYSIANSFNHSLTKKRITMMCKEKSTPWSRAKALYVLPVVAIAALSFSTVETANATVSETLPKGNEIVADNEGELVENYLANDDEKVFQVCENAPEFPGGAEAMMKFLSQNLKYPDDAKDAGKEGRAVVQFVVKKDGSISDAKIVRSTGDNSLDAEALRVVSSMPKWKPGMQGGKAVNVQFNLPVVFKLQNKKTEASQLVTGPVIEFKGENAAIASTDSLNAAIVVNGALYDGNISDIDSNTIESITVVKIEALPAEEAAKCKQLGKDGVIYIKLKKSEPSSAIGNEAVFQLCEQQPEFPGGEQEMMKYLRQNIKYPSEAREINAQGRFYVNFIVKKDGTICDVKVIKHNASSKYSDISAIAALEKHVENSRAGLEHSLNQLKEQENTITKLEKQYELLKNDNTAEVILERRRDELEKARADYENNSKRIAVVRSEIEALKQRMESAKKNVSDVVVVAYKNSNEESLTAEKLAELDAKATQALIDEAVRVVTGMPDWKPGMQDGKPVNATFTLPIYFRLQ